MWTPRNRGPFFFGTMLVNTGPTHPPVKGVPKFLPLRFDLEIDML
jgi:hypothetical protein